MPRSQKPAPADAVKPARSANSVLKLRPAELMEVAVADDDTRLDRWLKRLLPGLSQGQVEKLLRTGQIRVDSRRAKASDRVRSGQMVRLPPLAPQSAERHAVNPVRRLSVQDQQFIRDMVIYEDHELIALNKPAGLAVQGGTKTLRHVDALLAAFGEGDLKPRLVHRIDRDTSGVLLVAKTAQAAGWMTKAFRTRGVNKIYWAVTIGMPHPQEGEIRGFMKKAAGAVDGDREMMVTTVHGDPEGLFAITDYAVVTHAGMRAAWVAMRPVTGRTHQLRFHMCEIGAPIVGDPKYRTLREPPPGLASQLHLHARAIELTRPHGPPLRIQAPLSPHMADAFDLLGFETGQAKDPFAILAR